VEQLETRTAMSGTWTPLMNLMPLSGSDSGNMMLLSNGRVMIQGGGENAADNWNWFALTPDSRGNYVDGTWKQLTSMHLQRLDYASVMLPNGDVMVLGGEYSGKDLKKTYTNETEIYDPVRDQWTTTASVPAAMDYGDEPVEVLPNGSVLTPDGKTTATYIYNSATDRWSNGPSRLNGDNSYEENWGKLGDGSIMAVPTHGSELRIAQRFVPGGIGSGGEWVAAGNLPSVLSYGPQGFFPEMGPPVLLPDGRFWQIGGNDQTALYTPPSAKHPGGSWVAGPSIPQRASSYFLTGADVPSAMMSNGQVLFTASPWLAAPTYFYLFDPKADGGRGRITAISPPGFQIEPDGPLDINGWYTYFLALPNGQILYDQRFDSQLWLYTPQGSPQNAWRPRITSITSSRDGTFTLTGRQLNGISEGAAFGDNAEMSTNYPIVTLTASNGTVYFARTFDWSSTGVQTGKARVSTSFTLPQGLASGRYKVRVSASGIVSRPFVLNIKQSGTRASSSWHLGLQKEYRSTFSIRAHSARPHRGRSTGRLTGLPDAASPDRSTGRHHLVRTNNQEEPEIDHLG
jgi:hypothetical protein